MQIGASSGGKVSLPAAVLRSSAVELMGSGLGSVSMDGLMASIEGVLGAASRAGLTLDIRAEPLAKVTETWNEPNGGARLVYTMLP